MVGHCIITRFGYRLTYLRLRIIDKKKPGILTGLWQRPISHGLFAVVLHRLLGECAGNRTQSHQNLESYVHFTYGSVILFFLNSRLRNRGMHTLLFPQEVAPIIWKEHQDSNLRSWDQSPLPYRLAMLLHLVLVRGVEPHYSGDQPRASRLIHLITRSGLAKPKLIVYKQTA